MAMSRQRERPVARCCGKPLPRDRALMNVPTCRREHSKSVGVTEIIQAGTAWPRIMNVRIRLMTIIAVQTSMIVWRSSLPDCVHP